MAVLGINFNASNFPMLFGFPVFFNNIFEYYFPVTTDKLVYDAGEVVSVTARGNKVVYRDGITATEQNSPTFNAKTYRTGKDLYLYLAIAVCAFVFAERLLYSLKAV